MKSIWLLTRSPTWPIAAVILIHHFGFWKYAEYHWIWRHNKRKERRLPQHLPCWWLRSLLPCQLREEKGDLIRDEMRWDGAKRAFCSVLGIVMTTTEELWTFTFLPAFTHFYIHLKCNWIDFSLVIKAKQNRRNEEKLYICRHRT